MFFYKNRLHWHYYCRVKDINGNVTQVGNIHHENIQKNGRIIRILGRVHSPTMSILITHNLCQHNVWLIANEQSIFSILYINILYNFLSRNNGKHYFVTFIKLDPCDNNIFFLPFFNIVIFKLQNSQSNLILEIVTIFNLKLSLFQ